MPLVSVLMPVRDAEATVESAAGSILRQTHTDLELVAVEDGSVDSTPDRLRALHDPRVRILETQGAGLVPALELGRRAARARWILRMDADDLAHPRRIELCLPLLLADPRVAVASCLVRSFPEARLTEGRRRYDTWLNGLRRHEDMARERFVESPLAHPAVLLRAEAIEAVGGYRDPEGPEDYDLWLRLVANGARLAKVDRILHFWREDAQRFSRQSPRYGLDAFARVRALALAVELAGRPAVILGAGTAGRRLARHLQRAGVEVQGFLDLDPRKVGRAPYGVPIRDAQAGLEQRGEALILTAVNAWGARARARVWLREAGLCEGRDFFLAG